MSEIAINAENIAKCYRLGLKEEIKDNLFATMLDYVRSPFRNYRKYRSLSSFEDLSSSCEGVGGNGCGDILWALRDVSFEVNQGEVLGIVGGNGAGKSTLLKILSRITDPTRGRAQIRGRVASLLEVGTGFHPELTGRENVFLNGTILGMTKKEVESKFDEIVAFSEIEKFIDTPVKRYSSGMRVRLAFAVAAHLEPEILLIDEVLAVGDAAFQKKCLSKMSNVAQEGRTILFISHNMAAVTKLCNRVVWLDHGQVRSSGQTAEVVSEYLSAGTCGHAAWVNDLPLEPDTEVRIKTARLLDHTGQSTALTDFDRSFQVEVSYDMLIPTRDLSLAVQLFDSQGNLVFETIDTDRPDLKGAVREPGEYISRVEVTAPLLKPGRYNITFALFIEYVKIIQRHEGVLVFDVTEVGYRLNQGRKGLIAPVLKWDVNRLN